MNRVIHVPGLSGMIGASKRGGNDRVLCLVCWVLFVAFVATPGALVVARRYSAAQARNAVPVSDFIYFYSMGRMLSEHAPSELYDVDLQKKVATEIHPLPGRQYNPNPYPPFIAILFRPLARLSYASAFLVWTTLSLCLYVGGLLILVRRFFPTDAFRRCLALCAALSYLPFLTALAGGQIATIGFFGAAIGISEDDRGRPFRSGLGFALCLYKPTLLVLILPMLLIRRRYKTLAGFVCGAAGLGFLPTIMAGPWVWRGYFPLLLSFGFAAMQAHGFRFLQYYIDFFAFCSALLPQASAAFGAIFTAAAGLVLWRLARMWRNRSRHETAGARLLWSATLIWTLVLNLYVPIYDSMLGVVAVITAAAVPHFRQDASMRRMFTLLWVAAFGVSWATVFLPAPATRALTVLFAGLGTLLLIRTEKLGRLRLTRVSFRFPIPVPEPANPMAALHPPDSTCATVRAGCAFRPSPEAAAGSRRPEPGSRSQTISSPAMSLPQASGWPAVRQRSP